MISLTRGIVGKKPRQTEIEITDPENRLVFARGRVYAGVSGMPLHPLSSLSAPRPPERSGLGQTWGWILRSLPWQAAGLPTETVEEGLPGF